MGNLSKNFSRDEFECECGCGYDTVDAGLLRVLQHTVDFYTKMHTKVRCLVNSGCRCVEHNENIQKEYNSDYVPFSSKSQHIYGKAADVRLEALRDGKWELIDPSSVYSYLCAEYQDSLGLGLYSNRVHIDSRETKARWDWS